MPIRTCSVAPQGGLGAYHLEEGVIGPAAQRRPWQCNVGELPLRDRVDHVSNQSNVSPDRRPVCRRQHDEGERLLGQILLMLDVLVTGDDHGEALGLRSAEEVAIAEFGPAQVRSVNCLVRVEKAR